MPHIKRFNEMICRFQELDRKTVIDKFINHKKLNGREPLYADVDIVWNDGEEDQNVYIKLNTDVDEKDDEIVYYCEDFNDFLSLLKKNGNPSDFVVVSLNEFFDEF